MAGDARRPGVCSQPPVAPCSQQPGVCSQRPVYGAFRHLSFKQLDGVRREAAASRGAVELQRSNQTGAGLGLFVARPFRKGDVICRFAGSLRADSDYSIKDESGERPATSHVLSLRSGGHVLDGAPIAEALASGNLEVVLDEGVGVQRKWRVRDLGLGCMVNHGPRAAANAQFILVNCDKEGLLPPEAYVQATSDVAAGAEVFCRYGNSESTLWDNIAEA